MKTITEIRSALADIETSLEEQRQTEPTPGLEHYIECLAIASVMLTDMDAVMPNTTFSKKEPLDVKLFKAPCSCGGVVYAHEKFCPNCGRELRWRK